LEGILDLGRAGNGNTLVRSHLGYFVKPQTEIFMATEFFPNTLSWHFQPGIGRQLTSRTYVGLKHDLKDHVNIGILKHQLGDNLLLHLERNESGAKTTAIRYRLHDYLSAEAISNHEKAWVRLIAEL
jgi:hypothetical protein